MAIESKTIEEAARRLLDVIDQGAPYCVGYTVNSVPVWREVFNEKADTLRKLVEWNTE
jgi:hypothetical protein